MDKFYKLARFDGWDFFTGRTINYRQAAQATGEGKIVRVPKPDASKGLCSSGLIHACRDVLDCFQRAEMVCSAYICEGKPIIENREGEGYYPKCGFYELRILEEVPMSEFDALFGFQWSEAVRPVNPFTFEAPNIEDYHLEELKKWAYSDIYSANSMNVLLCEGRYSWVRHTLNHHNTIWQSVVQCMASYNITADKEYNDIHDNPYINTAFKAFLSYQASLFSFEALGEGHYQLSPAGANLWKACLVPTYVDEVWRLHGGLDAEVLWEGHIDG